MEKLPEYHYSRWIPSTPVKVGLDKLEPTVEKQVQYSQQICSQQSRSYQQTFQDEITDSNAVMHCEITDSNAVMHCGFGELIDVPLQEDLLGHFIARDISGDSFHFEPVTPDHSNMIDKVEIAKSFDILEYVENQSSDSSSPVMGENFESRKATEHQIEMTKTPLKKRRKRKHRPKVIVEAQSKNARNQRTPESTGLQKVTKPKRKYERKSKPVNVLLDYKANGTVQGAKLPGSEVTPKSKRKYVRRKKIDQPSSHLDDGNRTRTTTDTNTGQTTQRSCRKSLNFGTKICALEGSTIQLHSDSDIQYGQEKGASILNDDSLVKESQASCSPTSCLNSQSMVQNHIESSKGKCKIVFSELTHDKEASTPKTMASDVKRVTRSSSNSKCSSSESLSPETQARKSKRRRFFKTEALEPCNINADGAHYNSLQAYQEIISLYEYNRREISNMHFPAIFKKRSEALHKPASSSILLTSIPTDDNSGYCTFPSNDLTILDPAAFEINKNASVCFQTLGNAKKLKKKRSKGVTGAWDLDSLFESSRKLPSSSNATGTSEDLRRSFVCMEALADINATVATKKRSNRFVVSFEICCAGSIILKDAEKFNCPDAEVQNALVPHQVDHQCQISGAIVPVKDPIRKPRAKVELDNETDRVWRLLLEDINSEGINGTDEQKAKWWDEEREVFRLRTESFIARMHQVQGDRRFTPWKGSVLDSVIGVFLTQNVSDHLSSSAFISMAARFPLKLGNTYLCKEISAASRVLNPDDTGVGNTYEGARRIIHPIWRLKKLYDEQDLNKFGSPKNMMLANFNGYQTELDEGIYSLNSVVSPYNSADSIGQTANRIESCSHSSTEAEPTGVASGCTSFVELLQMAGTMSHGVYRQGFGMPSLYYVCRCQFRISRNRYLRKQQIF